MIRELRLKRGWSQEQLAQMSGVSLRTIQRAERGDAISVESQKSISAVFDIHFSQLQENTMNSKVEPVSTPSMPHQELTQSTSTSHDYRHSVMVYVVVIGFLFLINAFTSPDYWWVIWPALGWGLGIVLKILKAYVPK